MTHRLLLFVLFLLINLSAFSQKIKESEILRFRVYDYKTFPAGKEFSDFSADDISKMTYYEIPLDSLKGAVGNPHRHLLSPVFKGSFFVTVDLENEKRRRLKVSTYGGFYKDLDSGKYYSLSEDRVEKFQNVLGIARRHLN
jgi:hypothetical protein